MALNCENTATTATGDNVTLLFPFDFTYELESQVNVYLYNLSTLEYELQNRDSWQFANAQTVEFFVPPPRITDEYGDVIANVFIRRITDVCETQAVFLPGSAIRAKDLNDNFEQILSLLQEQPERIKEIVQGTPIKPDQIEPLITEAEMKTQITGPEWNDGAMATAAASKRYFNTLVQPGTPDPTEEWEEGKLWYSELSDGTFKLNVRADGIWKTIGSGGTSVPFTPRFTLFVDTQGDDTNDGLTPNTALLSIRKAVEICNETIDIDDSQIIDASYDKVSGFVTITTNTPHELIGGQKIKLDPMEWHCGDVNQTAQFPTVTNRIFKVSSISSANIFTTYVGLSEFDHTYISGVNSYVKPIAVTKGDGYSIKVAPGAYAEEFPIDIKAVNLAIIGSSLRNTYIHPTLDGVREDGTRNDAVVGTQLGADGQPINIHLNEVQVMFNMDSGSYLTGFTFAGLKAQGVRGTGGIDPDPTYGLPANQGWVAAHRPESVITKSPYIQNCTHFSDLNTDNANFDTNNLKGEGGDVTSGMVGGGILCDGTRVNSSSPLRSFVVDSFTQISLGGPGVLCTNNGYSQLVSFFGTFCHYHAKTINGGQLNLSNCTTDFGRYGLIADGKSAVPIFTASVKTDTAQGVNFLPINSLTKGTGWEPPREMVPLDHMVLEILEPTQVAGEGDLYPILSSAETSDGFNIEIFSPGPGTELGARSLFENQGLINEALSTYTVNFYLQSYISTGGHTMEFVGSGTDYRAHPDFGGVPEPENQAIEIGGQESVDAANPGRLRYVNGGRVWLSSTDENGNFSVGETFTVNQKTGKVEIDEGALQDQPLVIEDDIDLQGNKILQGPSNSPPDCGIQLQPNGIGNIILGTTAYTSNGERERPAAIEAPILENIHADFKGINIADLNRSYPVLTQKDLGYDADEVPVAGLLGKLAFTDSAPAVISTQSSPLPNELTFSVSGTTLTIRYQPTDGSPTLETTLTLSLPSVP
jgi:hypothetical protein